MTEMNSNKRHVIGLTGGIGSGKSLVCRLLAERGVPIIDTDLIARDVVAPGTPGLQIVIDNFGKDYLLDNGELNRKKLRNLIFEQPEKKRLLESILHPLIHQEMLRQIRQYQSIANSSGDPSIIVVAIPLLTEKLKDGDQPDYLDEIWVVDCSEATQLQRAASRDSQSPEQIQAIMKQQSSRQHRLKWADRTIHNDGTREDLERQIDQLLGGFQTN